MHKPPGKQTKKMVTKYYHDHAIAIVKSCKKLLERFVWHWPSPQDHNRPTPSLYSCFFAVDEVLDTCCTLGGNVEMAIEGARLHVRRTRPTPPPACAGITKSTSHEIAEEIGRILAELLAVTQPPYDFDEMEEIERDLEIANVQEGYRRNLSRECDDWDDQDLKPLNARRVGPDWFAFQGRFAKEVSRKIPKLCVKDLENLTADIELEFARDGATVPLQNQIVQAGAFLRGKDRENKATDQELEAARTGVTVTSTDQVVEAGDIDWKELLTSPPLSARQIAEKLKQPLDLVERELRYYRSKLPACYIEDDNAPKGTARYLHRMPDVLPRLKVWEAKRQKKKPKAAE